MQNSQQKGTVNMVEKIASINQVVNGFIWGVPAMICIIGVGLLLSVRTRFIQIRKFGVAMKNTVGKIFDKTQAKDGSMSPFQAVCTALAGTVGTGNIAGVAAALVSGGPGAVFWMWMVALLGGASAFIESTLAQIYKRRSDNGEFYGGPSYYIESALHNRGLAVLFAVSLILTYAGGFNMLASYNLQSTFSVYSFYNPETTPWIIGGVLAVLVCYCLLGGGKRVVKVTSLLVPVMGIVYVLVSLVVILTHITLLPQVLGRIFRDAFDFRAIFGGFASSIKRGLYSNEAGCGSAPNAAACADVSHPVKQGLVQMLSVFIDTLLLCTCTAFMCLCSGMEPDAALAGAPYVQAALRQAFGPIGPVFITVFMVLFAFTTLLGNLFYMDNLFIYLHKGTPSKGFMTGFRIVASLVVFVGAGMSMGLLWDTSDVMMGLMTLINVPVILILGGTAIKALDDYTAQRAAGKNPVFKASTVGLEGKTDYWND